MLSAVLLPLNPIGRGGTGRSRRLAARVLAAADAEAATPAVSVTDNANVPPSGDRRDYQSIGIYWWPDPSQPGGAGASGGLPWVRRDGHRNPATADGDASDQPLLERMLRRVGTLATAWAAGRRPEHAAAAAEQLRVWFLDPERRMNPHLRFGQGVPGKADGRPWGVIETRRLPDAVDASAALASDPDAPWSAEEHAGVRGWASGYLDWLLTSDLGVAEGRMTNNHALWYDAQAAALALQTDRLADARRILLAFETDRLDAQVDPDGRMPEELARPKSLSYSAMSLEAILRVGFLADRLAEADPSTAAALAWARARPGSRLRAAIGFLRPHLADASAWPHPQLGEAEPGVRRFVLLASARRTGEPAEPAHLDALLPADATPDAFDLAWSA